MLLHEVHYSIAASVSIFQSFLRPFGDALTEETLREVAQQQPDTVRQDLYDIYGSLATAATKTYQLVRLYIRCDYILYSNVILSQIKSDINIYECVVPHLPANTNVILTPHHLQQVSTLTLTCTVILLLQQDA